MRELALFALLLLLAASAGAQSVSGRALLTFEQNDSGEQASTGLRQSYDLGLQGYLTNTSLVRLFFHGDDFRGTTEVGASTRDSGVRVLQPSGELAVNADTFRMQLRGDFYDTAYDNDGFSAKSTLERSLAMLMWQPVTSTMLAVNAQRNVTRDELSDLDVLDEIANGSASYSWRGLQLNGSERFTHSTEGSIDRQTLSHQASFEYGATQLDGKLSVAANGLASFTNIDETPLDRNASSVPIPVAISRALYGVDDTPLDNRDHPLSPYPMLIDGGLSTSAGVSLSPTSPSFQNLALDLGRIERLDEIRVVVRDRSGNPLRNGGGPVSWDAYVSDDGLQWTLLPLSQTNFNRSFSRYEITFDQLFSRWFKVVSFGVNADETLVTEVQGVYHAVVEPGEARNGADTLYTGGATVVVKPVKRLTVTYNGNYNALRHEEDALQPSDSKYIEHLGSVELQLLRMLLVRGEYARRDTSTTIRGGRDDDSTSYTGIVEFAPTRQLRVIGEVGRQNLLFDAQALSLDTRAIRLDAAILRSLTLLLTVGQQTQTFDADGRKSVRDYIDLTSNARLTTTLRLLLLASLQNVSSNELDPAVQLLGARHDNRASAEFVWQPGRPLTLGARVGWVSGAELSGFTHRLRLEWYPFAAGTLMLGGSFDQDIDPVLDRRSTRATLTPRWLINSWAALDLNYTMVTLTAGDATRRQRSLYATLTLTR
ncbi:MAG TPA: hypothetical protein VHW00_19760 [Thermoanaerobaculia bacterium]|nr:hypothetical protein [Thermoanaerobaculia bacterium]